MAPVLQFSGYSIGCIITLAIFKYFFYGSVDEANLTKMDEHNPRIGKNP